MIVIFGVVLLLECVGMFSFKSFATVAVACGMGLAYGITPNKLVSGGIPAHTESTTTDYLTDGYLTNWKSSNAKEIALMVGEGPKKLLKKSIQHQIRFAFQQVSMQGIT